MLGQPAGTEAEAAVGLHGLAHDQLQHAIGRHRGDGVFPRPQRRQGIDQRLGMQADQVREACRQLALGQGFTQAQRLALEHHRFRAVETGVL